MFWAKFQVNEPFTTHEAEIETTTNKWFNVHKPNDIKDPNSIANENNIPKWHFATMVERITARRVGGVLLINEHGPISVSSYYLNVVYCIGTPRPHTIWR